ncbi:MAG: NAD-dependent epimerase/dehydratase family protein, partial [Candidatus Colwellbacteria bacterium]
AGFIGSCLAKRLIDEGHKVLIYDNLSMGKKNLLPGNKNLKFVKGDILDIKLLAGTFRKFSPDYLVHLAAIHFIPFCNKYPVKTVENNIMGTKNVLEAAENNPRRLKRVLLASSGAVYYGHKEGKHGEEKPPRPTEMYSYSKYVNELQLFHFHSRTDIDSVAMRFFNVYGPGETNPHLIPAIIDQLKLGKDTIVIGNPKPKRPYVFVKDIADSIIRMASAHIRGFRIYNVGSPKEYSAADLIKMIGGLTGRKIKFKVDRKLVRKNDVIHFRPSLARIRGEIGWAPSYDIRSGLAELLVSEKINLK